MHQSEYIGPLRNIFSNIYKFTQKNPKQTTTAKSKKFSTFRPWFTFALVFWVK